MSTESPVSSTAPSMSGTLQKIGGRLIDVWQSRYFELVASELRYFEVKGGPAARNSPIILNSSCTVIHDPATPLEFKIAGPCLRKTVCLRGTDAANVLLWTEAIRASIAKLNPTTSGSVSTNTPETITPLYALDEANGGIKSEIARTRKVTLDDFHLISVIGRGSFGKVMKVMLKDDPDKIPLAMKLIHKETVCREGMIQATHQEKNILQKLRHPFIVRLYYAFQSEERLYLIQDLLGGGELFFHLRNGPLAPDRVLLYAAELVSALTYLQSQGVVYRDLKPENIVLDSEGHCCFTDFGLAKVLDHTDKTNSFCGTPEYLCPEILLQSWHNRGADWWALGCVIYEMLVGLPPFYSEQMEKMYDRILHDPLVFPRTGVSPEAQDLISKFLIRDPEKRLIDGAVVKAHPYFASIDWEKLDRREILPVWQPSPAEIEAGGYVDSEFSTEIVGLTALEAISKVKQEQFSGFSFASSGPLAANAERAERIERFTQARKKLDLANGDNDIDNDKG